MASRPFRAVFALLGVALGVALYLAIAVINAATVDFFRESVLSVAGKAPLAIRGDENGFPEEVLETVEAVDGVKSAVPLVETRARFIGKNGAASEVLVVLGIDLLRETAVRAYKTDGSDEEIISDPLEFLNQEDSIVLTKPFAGEHALKLDSHFDVVSALGKKPLTVRGLLTPEGPAKAFGGRIAFMDIDGARMTFGREGKTDRIDIVPKEGVDEKELSEKLERAVGPSLHVERPTSQTEGFQRTIAGYQAAMGLMGLLALLVAMFLISNSMAVAVAERRRDIGMMRAVGATRSSILVSLIVEAAVIGLLGAALGIVLGKNLANALVGSVSQSMSAQFVTPIDVGKLQMTKEQIQGALILGLVSSVIAALWPAYRATKIPAVEALRPKEAVDGQQGQWLRRLAAGIGILFLAYVGFAGRKHAGEVPLFGRDATATIAILGVILLAPSCAEIFLRLVRSIVAWTPLTRLPAIRLACENLLAHRRRTTSSILSMVVGLVLVIMIATVQHSLSSAMQDLATRTLNADFYVSTNLRFLDASAQPMREEIGEELKKAASDGTIVGLNRTTHTTYEGKTIALRAWANVPLDPRVPFYTTDVDAVEAARKLADKVNPTALVSENFALHHRKKPGDTIAFDTPSGRIAFSIAATVVDFSSPEGTVYIARDWYLRYWNDPLVTAFFLFVPKGENLAQMRDRIDAEVCQPRGLIVTLPADLMEWTRRTIDDSFAYSHAIEFAALIVGLLGLLNTVLIHVLERTREFGMLRAVGMARTRLYSMVVTEALLQGIAAALVAAVLGTYVSFAWLGSDIAQSLGWPIAIHVPSDAVRRALTAGILVGIIAGIVAAGRASRASIRDALEYE